MNSFSTRALAAALLFSISSGQNTTQPKCAGIEDQLRFNASTTYDIPALIVDNKGNSTLRVEEDSAKKWRLTYRLQGNHYSSDTQSRTTNNATGSLFVDVRSSTNENLGACHFMIPPQVEDRSYRWRRDVLERSLKDTGDCKEMLGTKCIDALKEQYKAEAADRYMMGKRCGATAMPAACDKAEPYSLGGVNMTQDLTSMIRQPDFKNSSFDANLECDGLDPHSNRIITKFPLEEYDVAVRFPSVGVFTFWPNGSDPEYHRPSGRDDVHVEVVCLRPDQVKEGSVIPPDGKELLKKPGARFSNSGKIMKDGAWGGFWMLMLWSGSVMTILLAL